MSSISIGWDEESLEIGFPIPVWWDCQRCPHLIITGATGSGKSYAAKQIMARIGKIPAAHIYLLDYKADDYKFAQECRRYYAYTSCQQGLDSCYKAFEARQQGTDTSRTMCVLFFDEWAAYCQSMDKKQAEVEQRKLSTLLMLGRSYNFQIIICVQRADAQFFNTARDNFNNVLALGNLSDEGKQMLFAKEHREQMKPDRKQGSGYFYSGTGGLRKVIIPAVNNVTSMEKCIRQAVDRE